MNPPRRQPMHRIRSAARKCQQGMSLVEVTIALAIMAVAIMALISLIATSMMVTQSTSERAMARSIVERTLAQLRSELRNAVNDDNNQQFLDFMAEFPVPVGGITTLPENAFASSLDFEPNPDFATDSTKANAAATNAQLVVLAYVSESVAQTDLGIAKLDLDYDGDNGDVVEADVLPADLKMIPVRVTLTWRPRDWKPGGLESTLSLSALLY